MVHWPRGYDAARFLRDCWQRRPLYAAGAVPELAAQVDRSRLFALAGDDGLESRLVLRTGRRWSVEHGPFTRRRLAALPPRNWTLLVNGVENALPEARALQMQFGFIPYARHHDVMISYAAPGGGVGPHYDSYDVFLLQGFGRRRWQLSAQRDLALVEGAPLKLLRRFRPTRERVAAPGDLLYLPPRHAHHGTALEPCMTWSVGLRAPTVRDLLHGFLDDLHERAAADTATAVAYRDAGLKSQRHPAALPPRMVETMHAALEALRWGPGDVARSLGAYLSEPPEGVRYTPPGRPPPAGDFARQARRAGLRLHLKSRLLFDQKSAQYYINGETVEGSPLSAAEHAFLRALADRRRARPPARLGTGAWKLLSAWYRAGWIEIDGPGAPS